MQKLIGKVAVVTGAGRGIGAAIARRFAQEGASVAIAELDPEAGQRIADLIAEESGGSAVCIATDIADPANVRQMGRQVAEAFGPADILVNNAGITVFKEPLAATEEDWQRCMDVDLKGAWLCSRAVLPGMLEKRSGAIINIISNHACSVMTGTFPYPVAKHALLGLTRSLALEYASRGVAVNAISPGYTDTPATQRYFDSFPDPARARADAVAKQPVGRLCRPDEIAAVAVLLASDEARFIIGENIVIDGGVAIRMYE